MWLTVNEKQNTIGYMFAMNTNNGLKHTRYISKDKSVEVYQIWE